MLFAMIGTFKAAQCATTVYLQVSDVHDQPMSGVILSTKTTGSTSPPSDVAGKTQITLNGSVQPGDAVVLVLVRAPRPGMRFYTPWEGFATVPKPSDAIPVVLGARVSVADRGGVNTDQDGDFKFAGKFAPGEMVLIHAEKAGYDAVDQEHPAGPDPVVIVIPHARRRK